MPHKVVGTKKQKRCHAAGSCPIVARILSDEPVDKLIDEMGAKDLLRAVILHLRAR